MCESVRVHDVCVHVRVHVCEYESLIACRVCV